MSKELITSIGSSIDGSNRYQGIIREFRLWKYSRDLKDMNGQRFYSLYNQKSLALYLRLNSGNEILTLYNADSKAVF